MLEDQTQYVASVKIVDTQVIGGVTFLVIQYPGIMEKVGYIALPSVRTIFPMGFPKPQNISKYFIIHCNFKINMIKSGK